MATVMLLRACTKSSRSVLLQMQPLSKCSNAVMKKQFTASPVLSNYFEARRGPFTPEEKKGGHMMDASTHWKVERVVALAMCGLFPTAFFVQGGAALDHVLSSVVYLHGFWGVNVVVGDYVEKFAPFVMKLWYVLAIIGFAGLINFNYNDVGVCKAIKMLWSL